MATKNSNKYTEKQDKSEKQERPQKQAEKPPWNSEYTKRPKQYTQKGGDNFLRKYFEYVPISGMQQLQKVVKKFPMFFSQPSQGCQSANNKPYGKSERIIHIAKVSEEEQNISWDSDGQIQLGAGLNKTALKKYEGVIPLKTNQLKRYEKQFLEDQLRQKAEEEQKNKKQSNKISIQQKVNIKNISIQSDSDDEIQITKTTNYETNNKHQIQRKSTPPMSQNIATDSQGQIDRFNSDSSESDDIFGENSEKSEEQQNNQQQQPQKQVGFGSVQFAKGQFGIFALSQGLKQDDEVWTIIDRSNNTKRLSSRQMDRDYKNIYLQTYPWMTFNTHSQYVDYFTFSQTRSIQVFMPKQLNNYQNKFDPSKKKRKFSTNQQHPQEDNNNNQRHRMNSAIYKPKKSNNNS